ncbi:peptidoglycan/LPS O-acetylase OafA/YrhL [Arthrobacter oryzae]|nr:peptidoglycan/LPS O-acetylase OafA/YrhL [Arthrobacter oryzae]
MPAATVAPVPDRPEAPSPTSKRPAPRRDIQGLRTVAVGLVIIYHIWPQVLPGGFVGVDVFFVISGFLIVGSLVREVETTGRIAVGSFYAKRIRRLLPAATLVLLATLAAMVFLLPQGRWQSISFDVVMAALQVQNWNQAFGSGSYEGATALVSPVQHYWSLAVEEQFYLMVPLCLMAAAAWARRSGLARKTVCLYLIIALSTASFVHSVAFTASDHDVAYFATTTRIWELGLGGILALTALRMQLGERMGRLLGWAGLATVFWCAFTFSTSMDFPGYVAVLPVAATVLVLAAGTAPKKTDDAGRFGASALLGVGPAKYVGDISYSLYLWHWPVVVFYVFRLGRPPGLLHGSVIALVSLAAAVASYHLVEQRFRHPRRRAAEGRRGQRLHRGAFVLASGLVAATVLAAVAPWGIVEAKSQQLDSALNLRQYPGAMALDRERPAPVPSGLAVRPDPAVAMKDVPLTGGNECGAFDPSTMGEETCRYGSPDAGKTMVVVGDSHAAQLVDPLVLVGEQSGWNVQAMVRNGCPFSAAPPESADTVFHNCPNQNRVSLERILHRKPDLVVVSGMTPSGYRRALQWGWKDPEALVSGYVAMLKPLRDAGIRVAVVMDTPYPDFAVPDCVQSHGPTSDTCRGRQRAEDRPEDPLAAAAARVPGVEVVDPYPYFCAEGACPSVVGNVLVYRDNHMTNSFARTLAAPLARMLRL